MASNDTFRLIITTKFVNNIERNLELDVCSSKNISSSSTITQYPLQDGSILSDHMWRNPDVFTVTGSFGLNSKKTYENNNSFSQENILDGATENDTDIDDLKNLNDNNRLASIQTVFEHIKNYGLLCTLTTLKGDTNSGEIRFKQRQNMALQSISWKEGYNTLDFSFTFQEIMFTSIQLYEVSNYGDLYPSTSMPGSKSLAQILQDTGGLADAIITALFDRGYIDKRDGVAFVSVSSILGSTNIGSLAANAIDDGRDNPYAAATSNAIVSGLTSPAITFILGELLVIIIASVVAKIVGSAIISALLSAIGVSLGSVVSAIVPVGTVIVAVVAIAVGLYTFFKNLFDSWEKQRKLLAGFNLINNYKDYIDENYNLKPGAENTLQNAEYNETDAKRLKLLMDDIQYEIETKFSQVTVYQISTSQDDNDERTVPIMINNDLCYFSFFKNTGSNADDIPWQITILDGCDENAQNIENGFGFAPVSELGECSRNKNVFYIDSTREYEVYILCPSFAEATTEEEQNLKQYLMSYSIIISKGPIEDNCNKLNDIIIEALENQGYTE